ncbi:MAG: SRPBCC family protein [Planctomycetota bacterium]
MRVFELHDQIFVPRPRDEVFPFFADAGNLGALTPPWLGFRITTPTPIEMCPGALIDYRLRLHGVPIRWTTVISAWDPPHRFVDAQLRGPYSLWRHEHVFTEEEGGTLITDRVEYAHLGGRLVNALFVERELNKIFAYRREQTRRLLSPGEEAMSA